MYVLCLTKKRVLPLHPDPGDREAHLPAATYGVREHVNGRRCGDLGGMLRVGDTGCAIDGTEDDPDIGGALATAMAVSVIEQPPTARGTTTTAAA